MAQKPLEKTQMQAAVDMLAKHNGNATYAAEAMGIARGTFQNRISAAKTAGISPSKGVENPNDLAHVKQKLKRTESALAKALESNLDEDAIRKVIGTLADKASHTIPPAWVTKAPTKVSSPGVPTLFLSDLHWAEVVDPKQINGVNKYNLALARERLHEVGNRAIQLLKIISPKLDYPGIVVAIGGDCLSGNIHEELVATNELNSMPTLLDLLGEMIAFIDNMADTFGKVFLPCVSGNHGRNTPKIWNKDRHATSFDWLLYQLLAKHFEKDNRVSFLIPDGPDALYKIYNYKYLLSHGDQFRSGGDSMIGCLGPIIRGDHKKRSRNGQIDMAYDVMLIGHWHQYIHHSRVIVNGSLIGMSEYAYNNNFGFEVPQQALWLTHAKHDITFRMPVHLGDKQKSPVAKEWVSLPK